MSSTELVRRIGPASAAALVVSNMVGTGIFSTSGFLAGDVKGGCAAEQQFVTSGQPSMLSVVDLDKDGTLDVLSTATHAKVLSWFRGVADDPRGTGIVSPEKYGMRAKKGVFTGDPVYRFTVSADFDGDGKADCVSSDPFESIVTVYKGSGSGRLLNAGENDQPMELDPGTEPGSISTGDVSNEGKIDFVVAVKGGLRFFLNTSGNVKSSFELCPPVAPGPFIACGGP